MRTTSLFVVPQNRIVRGVVALFSLPPRASRSEQERKLWVRIELHQRYHFGEATVLTFTGPTLARH